MTGSAAHGFHRVLVGVDTSSNAVAVAERAVGVAAFHNCELHVVSVVPVRPVGAALGQSGAAAITALVAAGHEKAAEVVAGVERRAAELGVPTIVHLIHGNPSSAILRVAAEVGADVIVVGNRGVTGQTTTKAIPEEVLYGALCDVLVVHTTPHTE